MCHLPDPGIQPIAPAGPALTGRFLPLSHFGSPTEVENIIKAEEHYYQIMSDELCRNVPESGRVMGSGGKVTFKQELGLLGWVGVGKRQGGMDPVL